MGVLRGGGVNNCHCKCINDTIVINKLWLRFVIIKQMNRNKTKNNQAIYRCLRNENNIRG